MGIGKKQRIISIKKDHPQTGVIFFKTSSEYHIDIS